jgi:hypothetical protein
MRRVASIVLLFVITIPPLIYFYLHSQDKDLAGVLLVVFGGFFVDRCIDAWDRHQLSSHVKGITDTIEDGSSADSWCGGGNTVARTVGGGLYVCRKQAQES